MAFTFSHIHTDYNVVSGGVITDIGISFFFNTSELVIVALGIECDSVGETQHFNLSGTCLQNSEFLGVQNIGSSTTKAVEWYAAQGTSSSASPIGLDYLGGLNFAGGVSDQIMGVVWAVYGGASIPELTVRQVKTAGATNATASVTLDNPVLSLNECFFIAGWSDASDSATAGSGWTEISDILGGPTRIYAQSHATPTGAQNGQVSAIASQANASIIMEIEDPLAVRGGGWGSVGIF